MAVQAQCKKCRHVCAADNIRQFVEDYTEAECEGGGKHDFEPLQEAEVCDNPEDIPFGPGGQICV